ncbi:MAG: hypothetical protein ACJ76Z_09595 [Thermoleophilaceae bacterium]
MATHTDGPERQAYAHWESPYEEHDNPGAAPPPPPLRGPRLDFRPLFMLLDAVRHGLPRELEEQFTTLLREVLMTVRALIDWYLERLEHAPAEPRVEDIPID